VVKPTQPSIFDPEATHPVADRDQVTRPRALPADLVDDTGVTPALDGGPMSYKAALKHMGRAATTRRQVFAFIRGRGVFGATSDEVEVALNRPHQTISATVNGLWNDLLLVRKTDNGKPVTRKTRWGNDAQVYVISEQGDQAWEAVRDHDRTAD
jgi:hypothetical protein